MLLVVMLPFVTRSDALVTSSFLLLIARMHELPICHFKFSPSLELSVKAMDPGEKAPPSASESASDEVKGMKDCFSRNKVRY